MPRSFSSERWNKAPDFVLYGTFRVPNSESFASLMYRVHLKNFEGPLDLLLFFIRRDELDIYDIPVSHITHEFLDYIRLMEELDLDVASEFIYMASLLMSIKARMMLPREPGETEELDEEDPRYELVQRLLEYKRYKEMAQKMTHLDQESRMEYSRQFLEEDQVQKQVNGEALKDVTMFELMAAFHRVLSDIKRDRVVHKVEKVQFTVEDQTHFVLEELRTLGKRTSFVTLCREMRHKVQVVTTFLAVLEMVKEQQIDLYVEEDPTDFYLDLKPISELIPS